MVEGRLVLTENLVLGRGGDLHVPVLDRAQQFTALLQTLAEVGELLRDLRWIELNAGVHRHLLKPGIGGRSPGAAAATAFLRGEWGSSRGNGCGYSRPFERAQAATQFVDLALHFVHLRSRRRLLHFAERLGDLALLQAALGAGTREATLCLQKLRRAMGRQQRFVGSLDPYVDQLPPGGDWRALRVIDFFEEALDGLAPRAVHQKLERSEVLRPLPAQLLRLEDLAVERPQRRITRTLYKMFDGGIEWPESPLRPLAGVEQRFQRFSRDARLG